MSKLTLLAALLSLTACPKPFVEEPIEPTPKEAVSVDAIAPVSSRDLIPRLALGQESVKQISAYLFSLLD